MLYVCRTLEYMWIVDNIMWKIITRLWIIIWIQEEVARGSRREMKVLSIVGSRLICQTELRACDTLP